MMIYCMNVESTPFWHPPTSHRTYFYLIIYHPVHVLDKETV